MLITLIEKERIYTRSLPEKIKGQFWITHKNALGEEENIIGVEGINNQWIIKSNKQTSIVDSQGNIQKSMEIHPLSFYSLYLKKSGEKLLLFTEPVTEERQIFKKYVVSNNTSIKIGRENGNDIVFSNKFVSASHATLRYINNTWGIEDHNSTNGTFVNEKRVSQQQLNSGDVVFILGFKAIIGKSFIAVNNPDNRVTISSNILGTWENKITELMDDSDDDNDEIFERQYFYRSPRFKRDIEKATFAIDSPPQVNTNDETPLLLMLGPSVTMGMASMTTGIFAINNAMQNGNITQAVPTVVMSFSMLLGTILWPMLTKRFEKNRKIKREALRQEKYKEYLLKMNESIKAECMHQSEILHENHITIEECMDRISNTSRNLWERSIEQNDFLTIRLGLGDLPLNAELKFNERKFTLDGDNLQDELLELCETPKILKKVPITVSLKDNYVTGVIGERGEMLSFAKGMIFQMAALHSYDELKFVFLYDDSEKDEFEFVKWLPHTWNDERSIRFVATNNNDVKEVSAYLEKQLENRGSLNESEIVEISPYYVIFAMNKTLAGRAEIIKQILNKKKKLGFSVVAFYDVINNLPKECISVIELSFNNSKIFDKNDISGRFINFQPDIHINKESEELAIKLANTKLDVLDGAYQLPYMLTFLEMFGVGKVEHLNCSSRWKENDPTKTLEAEIGVDTMGDKFKLDLHEKFHGPHGLVAGMTGSGKSEFIISYILSMAVNYHPNEVAFILIDYKGGGMAKSFEKLPHTVGVVTNLDGSAIKRSIISIQSELKRRQTLFNEAGKKVGVSNIDIYKYQKLFREGAVSEPLPHLFIVSDEFAELKTQQPEFMEQLISAARIGRSLGVHLILATQKPSGVVDDQIWSNSKFRVCLKVQEKADSMDMLKRPDAAELVQTGRFYLQVGYNELFELGQSAWAGAPYYPSDKVMVEKDDSIVVIDKIARVVKAAKFDKRKNLDPNPKKQLDAITEYLGHVASEEKIKIRPLWMPPIEAVILLKDLKQKYSYTEADKFMLNPVIGEYDDPTRQRQCLLTLPISDEGNVVVYGAAGNGKATFLTTLIYSLIEDHTPEELNLYILDFGAETLKAFERAPHVGDVVLSYESEKIGNLLKFLNEEIGKRKSLFADFGDYKSYISRSGKTMSSIVVMINNFSAFIELYGDYEDVIVSLTREGVKYGIYFVLTAPTINAVRYRILQNFKQLFALQLNDDSDYSAILGKTDGIIPSHFKGRGIFKADLVYEFQTAHIFDPKENTLIKIREYCEELSRDCKVTSVRRIPILPERVDKTFLLANVQQATQSKLFPIGVIKSNLEICTFDFEKHYVNLVLSQNNENAVFLQGFLEVSSDFSRTQTTVLDTLNIFSEDAAQNLSMINKDFDEAIVDIFNLVVERYNETLAAKKAGGQAPQYEKRLYIINSYSNLISRLTADSKEKLGLLLEKGESIHNLNFIVSESISSISMYSSEAWFRRHCSSGDGIWIGSGIASQYQLKISKITNDLYQELEDDFGYVVQKGKPRLIKLLSATKTQETGDESDG